MFDTVLIANRGEIARRIIRTARAMGLRTVAVHSDADARAPHVAEADEAVRIGPAPATESYLRGEAILEAARTSGAGAIHPGYGFLSERAEFARACAAENLVFIGPGPDAIAMMGDKIVSKALAAKAGVSTVPGVDGEIETAAQAVAAAEAIGYPVMIKASAGGGGKGMRIAHDRAQVEEGFVRAKSEAAASFGDDRVFLEKFIVSPRHIEIQVLADRHGACVHLGERECSVQRRNQKVVEEAPSPFLDARTRALMGEQAVRLAKAVDYESAGTVEFIVGRDRSFHFLEMNTRLQVEHPVTELTTGRDLVADMIRIARGEPLGFTQADVTMRGHAIETRVYAEDPSRGFLPSTGRLTAYRPPARSDGDAVVRVDDGVVEGSEISVFYDPMIAKLITHASTREAAIEAQAGALDAYMIKGVTPNLAFLAEIMRNPRFRAGEATTAFIGEDYPDGFETPEPDDARTRTVIAAAATAIALHAEHRRAALPERLRPSAGRAPDRVVRLGRAALPVRLVAGDGAHPIDVTLEIEGRRVHVASDHRPGDPVWRGRVDGRAVAATIDGDRFTHRGRACAVKVLSPRVSALLDLMPERAIADTSGLLLCPMPGTLVSLAVSVGRAVKAGEPLAVVEAMKMENVLQAERDGTVASIMVVPGDALDVDAVILTFERDDDDGA